MTQEANLGTYKKGTFEGRIRYDVYTPYNGEPDIIEPVLCLDSNDLSDIKLSRPTYNEILNCHSCFCGYAHSVNLCNNRQQNND
jgi:hypothetical protein